MHPLQPRSVQPVAKRGPRLPRRLRCVELSGAGGGGVPLCASDSGATGSESSTGLSAIAGSMARIDAVPGGRLVEDGVGVEEDVGIIHVAVVVFAVIEPVDPPLPPSF